MKSFLKKHGQKLLALVIWLSIGLAYLIYLQTNDLTVTKSLGQLTNILMRPMLGPFIFVLVYILHPIIFFPASILTVAGGALYGWTGVFWVIIGANASAMLSYVIGWFFGNDIINRKQGDIEKEARFVEKWKGRLRKNSFETVFIMRLLFLPFHLVNYLCGFLQIDWKPFLLATALGSIAGTIAFTLAGASIGDIDQVLEGELPSFDWRILAISLVIFVISLAVSRYFKRKESTNTNAASA